VGGKLLYSEPDRAMRLRFARFFLRPLFLTLLLGGLALAFLSFQRKVDSFAEVDFSWKRDHDAMAVLSVEPGTSAARAGLRPGDRIVLADGLPLQSIPNPGERLARRPATHMLVVVRGAQILKVTYAKPPPRVDVPYLFLAFVGFLYLLIGLITLAREPSPTSRLFWALAYCSFEIFVLTPAGPVDLFWKISWAAEDLFRALLPALLLHFFMVFPRPSRRHSLRLAIYAPGLAYFVASVYLAIPGALARSVLPLAIELLERAWLLYFAAYGAAAIVRAVAGARSNADPSAQKQVRWIALGVAIGLAPFLVLYAVPRALFPDLIGPLGAWTTSLGLVSLALIPLSFSYAILRWRLWDVEIFVREAVATTVAVFLGAATFVAINSLLSYALAGFAAAGKNMIAFSSGLILASLIVPMKRRLTNVLERIQYAETYRARRALLDLSRQLGRLSQSDQVTKVLAQRIDDALHAVPCSVFLFDGPSLPPGVHRDALEARLRSTDRLRIRQVAFAGDEDLSFSRLHALGYRTLFALRAGSRLIGALAVGNRDGRTPFSSEDDALLETVAAQASLAYENTDLYAALARQMSEIRSLQEYQESVIRSSSSGIVVVDAGDRILSSNPSFAALVARAEADLVGLRFSDVIPGAEPGQLPAGAAERSFEITFKMRDGEDHILRISVSPFRGETERRVVLSDDVTDRVRMERALSERERLASLGVLAAGVAHEVNTPLAGISSYAQMLLADTDASDPRYAILKKMERQTFRASHLVNNLLEMARVRNRPEEQTDLARILADAIESSEAALASRRIRVEIEGLEQRAPMNGQPQALEQVFVNLLVNARDASPEGAVVKLTLQTDGQTYRVDVEDEGPGISPEDAIRAFEPFYTTKRSGGTGLGLAIASEIVTRHGGTIVLVPRGERGGTCASVVLPARRTVDSKPIEVASAGLPHATDPGHRAAEIDTPQTESETPGMRNTS
jgi:two-component system, NtrC family, sensor kinase